MARDSGLAELSDERLERTFTTNLFALFWLTRAALPHMPEGSSIINNSSIQAYEPSQTLLDYAATKAAINNFTVNLAGSWVPHGIRVNAVAPGPIWTPLQPATQTEEKLAHFGQDTRWGEPASRRRSLPPSSSWPHLETPVTSPAPCSRVTGGKPVF